MSRESTELGPGKRDFLGQLHPIEATLAQLGINVREPGREREMHFYLMLLQEEIRMTEEFLGIREEIVKAQKRT